MQVKLELFWIEVKVDWFTILPKISVMVIVIVSFNSDEKLSVKDVLVGLGYNLLITREDGIRDGILSPIPSCD